MDNDLVSSVPTSNPDKDALTDYGLTAVSALIPVVGGAIADATRGIIARRAEERRHEFDVMLAEAVTDLTGRVEDITPQSMVDSDEFMAAIAKVSRVAAETESVEKRKRLATALTHMGPWSAIDPTRRQHLLDLVARYDDLDIFLLRYFRDPVAWLVENAETWQPGRYMMAGIQTILGDFVFPGQDGWQPSVSASISRFQADGVADVPLKTMMSDSGTVEKRTTMFGEQLLDFISDPA